MVPGLSSAAQAERIEQRLLGGPEGNLDLNGHARRREAEDVAGGVVPRPRRNPGVLAGERERLRRAAEGIGLSSARDEGPINGVDRPARAVDRGVSGTRPAPAVAVSA